MKQLKQLNQPLISLGELALELGINKSKLAYYFSLKLIKPASTIGRMNVFDEEKTRQAIKNIEKFKKEGMTLKQIKTV